MATRVFRATNWVALPTADATAIANNNYMALKGGSTNQSINITDVVINGMSSASALCFTQLARAGTLETTPTALSSGSVSDGPKNPNATLLVTPAVTFVAAAAGPQRASTINDTRLELGFNAFGGLWRMQLPPGEEFKLWGNVAMSSIVAGGEAILSAFTGGSTAANINATLTYEPF